MLLSAVWSTDSSPLFPRPSADSGVHCHVHVYAIQGKLRVCSSLMLNWKLFLTPSGGSLYSLEGPPDRTYCVEAAIFSVPVS